MSRAVPSLTAQAHTATATWLELPSPISFDTHTQMRLRLYVPGFHDKSHRVDKSITRWFTINGFRTLNSIGGDPEEEQSHQCSTPVALVISNFEAALTALEQHGVT